MIHGRGQITFSDFGTALALLLNRFLGPWVLSFLNNKESEPARCDKTDFTCKDKVDR